MPVQRRLGDRAPAEAGDHVVHARRQAGQREPDVLADDAARADGERLLEHDDALRVAERLTHLVERIRAEALDAERADRARPRSRSSSTTSSIVPEHRAERDDDRLGVLGPVGAQEPARVAAERRARSRPRSPGSRRAPASAWRA